MNKLFILRIWIRKVNLESNSALERGGREEDSDLQNKNYPYWVKEQLDYMEGLNNNKVF